MTTIVASLHAQRGIDAARETRRRLGVPLDRPFDDLLAFVEEVVGVPVAILALSDGVAGAYLRPRDRPLVFVNGREGCPRQRFTLAHELGHHLLGHTPVVDDVAAVQGKRRTPPEVESNYFAAELIAPVEAVVAWYERQGSPPLGLDAVVRLARMFGLSALAARYRLESARLLRDRALADALDREIEEGEHIRVARMWGVPGLEDRIAQVQGHLPRLPQAEDSALLAYLRKTITLEELAAATGRSPAEMAEALRGLGLAP